MWDAAVTINKAEASGQSGEKRRIYVTLTPGSGTLTIQAGATVTLTDRSGAVVGSISQMAVTGNTSGAAASVQAWYDLDVTSIAAGAYILTFTLQAVDGSGNLSRFVRDVLVVVR